MSGGMRVFKRGKVYHAYLYIGGKRVKRTTHCMTRAGAEAAVREWEKLINDPAYRAAHGAALTSAIERLLKDRAERRKAPGTLTMYRSKAGHLLRLLGADRRLAQIDAAAIDDYVSARRAEGAADATIHKEVTTLRGALRLAKRRGEFPGDIAAIMPIGLSGQSKARTRFLTETELKRLLGELRADRAAHVAFIVATGARWSESERARLDDVDMKRGEVRIRGTNAGEAPEGLAGHALPAAAAGSSEALPVPLPG